MNRETFDSLVPHLSTADQKIQQERCKNKEIKRLPTGGRQRIFSSPEEQLFFVLFYLKTYPTFDVLGFHFGLSAGHAHDYVEFFMRVLKRALTTLNQLPETTLETLEELAQRVDNYSDIIIDGVETPCVRPHQEERQKDHYSGKKRHTTKSLVISDHQRRILFVSPVFGGSTHDYVMLKTLFDPELPWFENLRVRLDLGFWGAEKDYGASSTILLPHKKPRKAKKNPFPELTTHQKKKGNRKLAKVRVLVEHAIGGMKHFHCLMHRIRTHSISLMNQFFALSAGLWNKNILKSKG